MALTIVVEDGTGLANAESYVDTTFVRNYAAKRGVALPASDDTLIPFMIQAMDYLESMSQNYIGQPTVTTQALAWPRTQDASDTNTSSYSEALGFGYGFGSFIPEDQNPTTLITSNVVPTAVKTAQAALTLIASGGTPLLPNQTGNFVTATKVGPLETHYSERLSTGVPTFPLVNKLLEPYMSVSEGLTLRTVRA